MSPLAAPPKRESTGDRRMAIAMAARALIVEKGFEGLRTRDIAERVGINIATLHYHVPTKEALICLVAESMRSEFVAQHLGKPRDRLTPLQLLRLEFADFKETMETNQGLLLVFAELAERGRRDPNIHAAIEPLQRKWHQIVTRILADGRDDGSFRPDLDPEAGARIVVGAIKGFWRLPDPTPRKFDEMAAELERAFRNPNSSPISVSGTE